MRALFGRAVTENLAVRLGLRTALSNSNAAEIVFSVLHISKWVF